jgi:riboflavin biosynthesis pyrimidine reductase
MINVKGPGEPFITLFDEQEGEEQTLPQTFAQIYSRWPLPEPTDRPFVYSNFVMSHDGRVSFNQPGRMTGSPVSRDDQHDRWLMGLLRARADAVLIGGTSIASAGNHVWTPRAVFREDADAFAALRRMEGRIESPLLVVLTRSGKVPEHAPSLDNPELPVLIATTASGAHQAKKILGERDWIRYLETGDQFDQLAVLRMLRTQGISTLLSEGGPLIYGSLLEAGLIDDAFVTLSPIMIGRSDEKYRPSIIEGVAFDYRNPPCLRLLSVHRHGSHLYLHSRYV